MFNKMMNLLAKSSSVYITLRYNVSPGWKTNKNSTVYKSHITFFIYLLVIYLWKYWVNMQK